MRLAVRYSPKFSDLYSMVSGYSFRIPTHRRKHHRRMNSSSTQRSVSQSVCIDRESPGGKVQARCDPYLAKGQLVVVQRQQRLGGRETVDEQRQTLALGVRSHLHARQRKSLRAQARHGRSRRRQRQRPQRPTSLHRLDLSGNPTDCCGKTSLPLAPFYSVRHGTATTVDRSGCDSIDSPLSVQYDNATGSMLGVIHVWQWVMHACMQCPC